jgi:hypothetical protein
MVALPEHYPRLERNLAKLDALVKSGLSKGFEPGGHMADFFAAILRDISNAPAIAQFGWEAELQIWATFGWGMSEVIPQ